MKKNKTYVLCHKMTITYNKTIKAKSNEDALKQQEKYLLDLESWDVVDAYGESFNIKEVL
jgi:hypothetical protein